MNLGFSVPSDITIAVFVPMQPAVFAIFLVAFAGFFVYSVAKWVISLWTGSGGG